MDKDLTKVIELEIALKTIEALPKEQKEKMIADALLRELKEMRIGYEVGKVLEAHAMEYVYQYAKQPEIQEKLKTKAQEVVNDVIEGITIGMGRELEEYIKTKYRRILSPEKYGEK